MSASSHARPCRSAFPVVVKVEAAASAALALTVILSCDWPPDAPAQSMLPLGAVPFSPPPRYHLWWSVVESCSGFKRDFAGVSWYIVPGVDRLSNGALGGWNSLTNQIVFAEHVSLVPGIVRHEMLHAVLGVRGHPREQFLGSCGDIVACDSQCGSRISPAPDAPEVPPHDVGTRLEVAPAVLSESADEGFMAIVVSITNPLPYDVWVRLTPSPNSQLYPTFGIIRDIGDTLPLGTQSVSISNPRFGLAANETRRFVSDGTARAGPLGVRAYFNSDTTPRVVFQVEK